MPQGSNRFLPASLGGPRELLLAVQKRFLESRGLDPIFRPNDGSNCEGADVSTVGKRLTAYSMLLTRGLIRVGIDVPVDAEFVIDSVDDPYGCGAPLTAASMYRRPLPTTNLGFLSAVMWGGRESSPTTTILEDLAKQADDATTGHAQASLHLTPRRPRRSSRSRPACSPRRSATTTLLHCVLTALRVDQRRCLASRSSSASTIRLA
jgi:hypothetical protein